MAKFGFSVEGSDITATVMQVTSAEDAQRIIAHGMRRFGTQDLQTVVLRFAELFMGNLIADVRADEQQIAAKAASDAVPTIESTPDTA